MKKVERLILKEIGGMFVSYDLFPYVVAQPHVGFDSNGNFLANSNGAGFSAKSVITIVPGVDWNELDKRVRHYRGLLEQTIKARQKELLTEFIREYPGLARVLKPIIEKDRTENDT